MQSEHRTAAQGSQYIVDYALQWPELNIDLARSSQLF